MNEHTFGGNWTEEKLGRLDKYLTTYRTIFANNERARHFRTWYVDAFAGTGSRSEPTAPYAPGMFDDVYQETIGFRDGSARIALQLADPFDNYLFIEKSKARVSELQQVVATDFAPRLVRCSFQHGDANALLHAVVRGEGLEEGSSRRVPRPIWNAGRMEHHRSVGRDQGR